MKNTLKNNRYHTSKHYHMFEKPVWSLKKKKREKTLQFARTILNLSSFSFC